MPLALLLERLYGARAHLGGAACQHVLIQRQSAHAAWLEPAGCDLHSSLKIPQLHSPVHRACTTSARALKPADDMAKYVLSCECLVQVASCHSPVHEAYRASARTLEAAEEMATLCCYANVYCRLQAASHKPQSSVNPKPHADRQGLHFELMTRGTSTFSNWAHGFQPRRLRWSKS